MPAPLSGNGLTINRSIIARSLLAILLPMTTYSPAWASTEVSEDVHEKCLKAADYLGCVEAQTDGISPITTSKKIDRFGLPTPGGAVAHIRRDGTISYFFPNSVVAVKNKNKYGRYLSWQYTYHYNDPGTRSYWRPGAYRCTGQGMLRRCVQTPSVFVRGRPSGPRSNSWRVLGDCVDYTAKWEKNGEPWKSVHGGRNFESEKFEEVLEVLNGYCPKINQLKKSPKAI
jgi:hypothetical protein